MMRVYSGRVAAIAYIVRSALEGAGIYAEIRNELRAQLAGGIPLDQGYVEVWVAEEDASRALAIVQTILSNDSKGLLSFTGDAASEDVEEE